MNIIGEGDCTMEQYNSIPARIKIASILRKAILAGEFVKGEELSLSETANRLGVSRTPVREAFQMLETDGLLQLRMNKGAIVRGIDRKFIIDHYETRMLLEGNAAFRAAQRRPDTGAIAKLCQETLYALRRSDISQSVEANQTIHLFIWRAADNQRLYSFLMSLWNGPSIGKTTTQLEHHLKSALEHCEIIRSIQDGNAEEARQSMERHIQRSMENILASFAL